MGLDFIVSCWDLNSLNLVEEQLNVNYHKVASALLTDKEFLQKLNDTGKPVIVSVGMATEEEIDAAPPLNSAGYGRRAKAPPANHLRPQGGGARRPRCPRRARARRTWTRPRKAAA